MNDSANALTPTLSQNAGRGGRATATLNVLSWAVYLGASWTWCIGMFLPVLLVRDYGIWAFVVFAVPNVVGAAAMAWVLPNAEASREFVEKHRNACEWFSIITVAFQLFFFSSWICFFFQPILLRPEGFLLIILALFLLVGIFRAGDRIAALAVTLVSVVVIAKLWTGGAISASLPNYPTKSFLDILPLAAVCTLGFLLCPYLDLTFHRARQETSPVGGRAAFAIGFGVVFFTMILFTFAYVPLLISPFGRLYEFSYAIVTALGLHFVAQLALKVVLHLRALRSGRKYFAIIVIVLPWSGFLNRATWQYAFYDPSDPYRCAGELIYRLFMSFYGLYFPAYVWICIYRRRHWIIWAASVLLATPMYWLGFIERQTLWLIPGVAIVLLAGLFTPKIASRTAT